LSATDLHLLYVVGEPGVGKSTAVDLLTAHLGRTVVNGQPKREHLHDGSHCVAVELGARLGKHPEGFPGTDAMSMSTILDVEPWLRDGHAAFETPLVLGEGARLANGRFIRAAVDGGFRVTVVWLRDGQGAEERRAARGSNQKDAWVRGQATKSRKFYELAGRWGGNVAAVGMHAASTEDVVHLLRTLTGLTLK
jgi:P-loop Nucleotide Kinase3